MLQKKNLDFKLKSRNLVTLLENATEHHNVNIYQPK